MGCLIAQGLGGDAKTEFRSRMRHVLTLSAVLHICVVGATVLLYKTGSQVGNRVLSPTSTSVLAVANILYITVVCLTLYVRAHKEERMTGMFLVSGLLSASMIWLCGKSWGALGASVAYASVLAVVSVPWTILLATALAASTNPKLVPAEASEAETRA